MPIPKDLCYNLTKAYFTFVVAHDNHGVARLSQISDDSNDSEIHAFKSTNFHKAGVPGRVELHTYNTPILFSCLPKEEMASVCPNMPLRNLIYVTELIKELVDEDNLFGLKLIKIPTPRFVVFYNGLQEQPERMILRLSDAFIKETDEPDLELKCSFYNINRGFNSQLMGNCKTLNGYMQFVDLVRCYVDQFGKDALETAISKAIDECIEKGILKDFLLKRRNEVERAMELDWSYERWFELEGREQYRDGHAEGHAEGLAEGLAEGHTEGLLEQLVVLVCKKLKRRQSREVIADALETDLETVERIIAVAQKYAPDYDVKAIVGELLAEKGAL